MSILIFDYKGKAKSRQKVQNNINGNVGLEKVGAYHSQAVCTAHTINITTKYVNLIYGEHYNHFHVNLDSYMLHS